MTFEQQIVLLLVGAGLTLLGGVVSALLSDWIGTRRAEREKRAEVSRLGAQLLLRIEHAQGGLPDHKQWDTEKFPDFVGQLRSLPAEKLDFTIGILQATLDPEHSRGSKAADTQAEG